MHLLVRNERATSMAVAIEVMNYGKGARDSNIVSLQSWGKQLDVNVITWLIASNGVPDLQIEDRRSILCKYSTSAEYAELTDENCMACSQVVDFAAKIIKASTLRNQKQRNNHKRVQFLIDSEGADM